jgi:hypothetical protein
MGVHTMGLGLLAGLPTPLCGGLWAGHQYPGRQAGIRREGGEAMGPTDGEKCSAGTSSSGLGASFPGQPHAGLLLFSCSDPGLVRAESTSHLAVLL